MEQTKATENLSQWFSLDEQKPWEPGVYLVKSKYSNFVAGCYWHGDRWGNAAALDDKNEALQAAARWKDDPIGNWESEIHQWRGLASDPSAKPKPKARGNRRVTRYVVMQRTNYASDYPLAAFDACNFADAYIASNKKSARLPMYVQKIRFRTPEAD